MKKLQILFLSAAAFLINGCISRELIPIEMEKNAILIDVRTPEEYQQKHIKGAVNLPLADIDTAAAKIIPDKNTPIYIYCRSGRRSKNAEGKLRRQGYGKIVDFGSMSNAEKMLNIP